MKLNIKHKFFLSVLILALMTVGAYFLFKGAHFAMLSGQGPIALRQREIIFTALGIMAVIVVPVYIMLFWIISHRGADKQLPNGEKPVSQKFKFFVWGGPIAIILCISILTWKTAHELDPFKSLKSDKEPLTIEVIALPWKWLFVYPDQQFATVNTLTIPVGRPVAFKLTADAPMNTIWIPELAGQVYAMAGMQNALHLRADHEGTFNGRATEINGKGYAGMTFTVHAVSEEEFSKWTRQTKTNQKYLTMQEYEKLAEPSENNQPEEFGMVEKNLFHEVMEKFMAPPDQIPNDK